MKKLKKLASPKKPNIQSSLALLRDHDLSAKVKAANGKTRMNGKQEKVIRLNIPGEGLQKFKKR